MARGWAYQTLDGGTTTHNIETIDYTGSWIGLSRYDSAVFMMRTHINSTCAVAVMLDAGQAGSATTTYLATQWATLSLDVTTTANTTFAFENGPLPQYCRVRIAALTTTLDTRVLVEMIGRY